MKAIQFDAYGGTEVLHVIDAPDPHPAAGQVRVHVKAIGVNPIDLKLRSGVMKDVRPLPLPSIPGMELAGVIDEVGSGVTAWKVGDEVLGWSETGAYAEYALATQLVRKPANLAWDVAAAVPIAASTAQRVLDELAIKAGDTLLVHGGAGAVGGTAVQLAIQRGARVIATANAADLDYVNSLGATAVTYGDGLSERIAALELRPHAGAPHGIDAVLDAAGTGVLPVSIELRGGTSRIITIADMASRALGVPFSAGTADNRDLNKLEDITRLAAAGIRFPVGAKFALAEAKAAQDKLAAGHNRGKIVLVVE